MPPFFNQITILAPGLLGASLGQAVAAEQLTQRTVVWARRPETRLECEEQPWCAATCSDPGEAVQAADLVVLCMPVAQIVPTLERIAPHLAAGTLVTDVGSTKSLICRQAEHLMPPGCHFIGSHPMAGSERTGMANAQVDLFVERPCFVTPLPESDPQAVETVVRFWKALHMKLTTLSPAKHDEIVAAISHLPHLVATAICLALREGDPDWARLAGNGLRDTTRVAAGSPTLWRAICEQNREEVLRALQGFEKSLQQVRSALENRDYPQLEHLLDLGKQYRQTLDGPSAPR